MLSIPHLVVIFLIALIVLGPEKLPQVARVLGKAMADFRRITTDFRVQIEDEMREMERHTRLQQMSAAQASPYGPTDPELLGTTACPARTTSATASGLYWGSRASDARAGRRRASHLGDRERPRETS